MGTDRNVSEPERSEYKGNLIYHSIQATRNPNPKLKNGFKYKTHSAQAAEINTKHRAFDQI